MIEDDGKTAFSVGNELKVDKTILLVEDEQIVREMIGHILLTAEYDVTPAADGAEALEICRKTGKVFDLLLTDFNMPRMDGRQLAEKIREKICAQKVLFISGFSDNEEFLKDISESEEHFLAKPFSPEALITKVKEILEAD